MIGTDARPKATSFGASKPQAAPTTARNIAIDAYRGFVMLLMMAEVLRLVRVSRAYPDSRLLAILAYNQTHVPWAGCSLHDLIQPSFSFLVGVALAYSVARRIANGDNVASLFRHALWRSLILIAFGVFLRSVDRPQTNFMFEDTLTQIGLGYSFLFLLSFQAPRVQWGTVSALLIVYWAAWALYPLPGPGYDYQAVGVPPDWPYNFGGFAAHWNRSSNLGLAFDLWFLNLFPREQPFVAAGGVVTLNFIPTLATMVLGLVAGRWLCAAHPAVPVKKMLVAGCLGLVSGIALHVAGVCPVVKNVWTPSWVLFSGGACSILLAAFSWVIEVRGYRRWSFPLVVIGLNSIAAYMMAELGDRFIIFSLRTHLRSKSWDLLGQGFQPALEGVAVLLVYWLILFWMYRRKIFLKI